MRQKIKNLFKTKYRIVQDEKGWFIVQEHEPWDLVFGWWWHIGCSDSYEGAMQKIEEEKKKRNFKRPVVYEE